MAFPQGMCSTALVVTDPAGFHLRPAATIAQVARQYDADVSVEYDGQRANGKSLLDMCMLAAQAGARLTVSAVGRDARIAVRAIEDAFLRLFGGEAPRPAVAAAVALKVSHSPRPTPPVQRAATVVPSRKPDAGPAQPGSRVPPAGADLPHRSAPEPQPPETAPKNAAERGKLRKKRQVFVWAVQAAEREAFLVGSFNNWEPLAMTRCGDRFEVNVSLAPGEYQYKFMVDGQWHSDPAAPRSVPNAFGTTNSVVCVS